MTPNLFFDKLCTAYQFSPPPAKTPPVTKISAKAKKFFYKNLENHDRLETIWTFEFCAYWYIMDPELETILELEALLAPSERSAESTFLQAQEVFADRSFLLNNGVPYTKLPPEFTAQEKNEALSIFLEQPDAPLAPTTSGAAKALEKLLKRFDYNLPNATNKMRQYLIFKMFELAESDDPKLAIKALEMLGKVSEIGLFSTKIEIATTDKPTKELETELSSLLATYSLGDLVAREVKEAPKEITDEELRGEVHDET